MDDYNKIPIPDELKDLNFNLWGAAALCKDTETNRGISIPMKIAAPMDTKADAILNVIRLKAEAMTKTMPQGSWRFVDVSHLINEGPVFVPKIELFETAGIQALSPKDLLDCMKLSLPANRDDDGNEVTDVTDVTELTDEENGENNKKDN